MAVGSNPTQRHGAWRLRAIACAAAFAAVLASTNASAESTPAEYDVKAAFLLNFARLVEWPNSAFVDPLAPFTVGLHGSDALHARLSKFLDGRLVGKRTVATRRISNAESAAGCHLVFVGKSGPVDIGDIVNATRGKPVLLVGESAKFTKRGGAIRFFIEAEKIRFEINPKATEAAALRVSSRLMRVAKIVSGN